MLNEHCQKMNLPGATYVCTQETVASSWVATVTLDVYTATGAPQTTKQGAKAAAAKLLIEQLVEQQIWHKNLPKLKIKN